MNESLEFASPSINSFYVVHCGEMALRCVSIETNCLVGPPEMVSGHS